MPPRARTFVLWRASACIALAAILATLLAVIGRAAWIGTGFYAKQLCSEVFVGGRAPADVVAQDLDVFEPASLFRSMAWQVDAHGVVAASWLGIVTRKARFQAGRGCVLRSEDRFVLAPGTAHAEPVGSLALQRAPAGADIHLSRPALQRVVAEAFDEAPGASPRRTRAVLVLQHGRILAERYAGGFHPGTRFCGWSMTKSVINALLGVLAQQGRLRVDEPVPIALWSGARDPRGRLTYNQLLHMSSGLAFTEDYGDPFSDVATMLYGTGDAATYAADKPLVAAPDTRFAYGSGTTNLITRALRHLDLPGIAYEELPRRLLFDPLGMRSALIEMDESGTFVGSSSMYATARDWARFGALFAEDGVWNGYRMLPEGWVTYSATPGPADSQGSYGAHFWLYDAGERANARRMSAATIPADAFFAGGFGGQRITIIPSRGLVIVRLGYTLDAAAWNNAGFVAQVLDALAPTAS
jgi:CubicO group peptidase (beta-lactamase class C family)